MPHFGEQAGSAWPTQPTDLTNALINGGRKQPVLGRKRKADEAEITFVKNPIFKGPDLVGGTTFRASNQHEGLPTALAEAYADGSADRVSNRPSRASLKASGAPWGEWTEKAYDAGYKLGQSYAPLTRADALRSLTDRAVLVSPPGSSGSGRPLRVAGFHPSSISKSVPESTYAHQELFRAQATVLEARAQNALSNDAADIALAAIHLASLAPGEYVAHANFTKTAKSKLTATGRLLPGDAVTYETRRENLKHTIASRATALTTAERVTINGILDDYIDAVSHPIRPKGLQRRQLGRTISGDNDPPVTSPRRRQPIPVLNPPELQSGIYDFTVLPPTSSTVAEAARPFYQPN